MIESTNSSVLKEFEKTNYELVYNVDETIRDVPDIGITDIKSFANSVVLNKEFVLPTNSKFLIDITDIVSKLRSSNLSVYVRLFSNEFSSMAWDFFTDPYVELNSFAQISGMSGVVTDFPATSNKYRKNRCLGVKKLPAYMTAVEPASLLKVMERSAYPPTVAPAPLLTMFGIDEASFPAVPPRPPTNTTDAPPPSPPLPKGQASITAIIFLSIMSPLVVTILLS